MMGFIHLLNCVLLGLPIALANPQLRSATFGVGQGPLQTAVVSAAPSQVTNGQVSTVTNPDYQDLNSTSLGILSLSYNGSAWSNTFVAIDQYNSVPEAICDFPGDQLSNPESYAPGGSLGKVTTCKTSSYYYYFSSFQDATDFTLNVSHFITENSVSYTKWALFPIAIDQGSVYAIPSDQPYASEGTLTASQLTNGTDVAHSATQVVEPDPVTAQ